MHFQVPFRCFPDGLSFHAGICWVLCEKASKSATFFLTPVLHETGVHAARKHPRHSHRSIPAVLVQR